MVLSDRTIKEELAKGRIVIEPLDPQDIQPASVDIHLDNKFQVFQFWKSPHVIDPRLRVDHLTALVEVEDEPYFSLQPGHFILGGIREYLEVPDDIMARLEGKSSLGRIGLMIHATAGFVDPGWKGHLTLELSNASPFPIMLYPGMKISQISFQRLTTPADRPYGTPGLRSKYQWQGGPTASRAHLDFPQLSLFNPLMHAAISQKTRIPAQIELRTWLAESSFQGDIKRFAKALDVPIKTVEDWFYRGAKPSKENRAKISEVTQLPQFRANDSKKSRYSPQRQYMPQQND